MILVLALQVFGVFLMLAPGFALRRRGLLSETTTAEMARFLFWVVYPCLIFTTIYRNYTPTGLAANWPLPVTNVGLIAIGFLVGLLVGRCLRFRSPQQRASFLYQTSFNNFSFLPMPIIAMLFGDKGVAALIVSTLGAELGVWTLGVHLLSRQSLRWENLRHLLSPPLLALVAVLAAVMLRATPPVQALSGIAVVATVGDNVLHYLGMIGGATIPLAMLVAGSSMATLPLAELRSRHVWIASTLRLVAIPLLTLTLLHLLPLDPAQRQVLAVVAVMPCSFASITMGRLYDSDEHFMSGSVMLSHLLALVTVPLLLALAL